MLNKTMLPWNVRWTGTENFRDWQKEIKIHGYPRASDASPTLKISPSFDMPWNFAPSPFPRQGSAGFTAKSRPLFKG